MERVSEESKEIAQVPYAVVCREREREGRRKREGETREDWQEEKLLTIDGCTGRGMVKERKRKREKREGRVVDGRGAKTVEREKDERRREAEAKASQMLASARRRNVFKTKEGLI